MEMRPESAEERWTGTSLAKLQHTGQQQQAFKTSTPADRQDNGLHKGRVLGHKRAKRNTRPNTSLLQIEGVANKEDAQFYLGKRVAYIYRAKREIQGSKVRVIWGRVTRPHGNSGVVKSKFRSNLPPHAFGASVRVMLFPSNI
ncbi:hypothetical protein PYCCODRAFT_1465194 [Trametes coccinea BRFM310]|uniref:60S ribosomal protein L33-A-like protein n=1 Tax=Trametes coccinea (strain BRFM310) TaxID=1353009 RepID=A0A1Y2IYF0_TRAC3|nr:hypothetical protein PYCCODRAFT_1465194 [Trametes coccinea BRFM310]